MPSANPDKLNTSRKARIDAQPGGMASSKEWIQIDRAEAADYEKDLELFQTSLEFVKAARAR